MCFCVKTYFLLPCMYVYLFVKKNTITASNYSLYVQEVYQKPVS